MVSLFGVEFKHRFWHSFFHIFLDFVPLSGSILAPVSIILALFFEHRFRINFSSILNRILTSIFMFFHDFPDPHTHLAKPRFLMTVWWFCMVLHIGKT